MKPETIKAIFTNVLFVIGVILLIVGFIQGTRTVVKLLTFDTYPLDTWEETKCDQPPYDTATVPMDGPKAVMPEVDSAKVKSECKLQVEHERKVRLTEDIVGAITMLISGSALIFFFRRYILK